MLYSRWILICMKIKLCYNTWKFHKIFMTRLAFVENNKTCEVDKLGILWLKVLRAFKFMGWFRLHIKVGFQQIWPIEGQIFLVSSISIGHCVQDIVHMFNKLQNKNWLRPSFKLYLVWDGLWWALQLNTLKEFPEYFIYKPDTLSSLSYKSSVLQYLYFRLLWRLNYVIETMCLTPHMTCGRLAVNASTVSFFNYFYHQI